MPANISKQKAKMLPKADRGLGKAKMLPKADGGLGKEDSQFIFHETRYLIPVGSGNYSICLRSSLIPVLYFNS